MLGGDWDACGTWETGLGRADDVILVLSARRSKMGQEHGELIDDMMFVN